MQNQMFLLNFYKLLSNVATKLVGAFIPIIILQATGSVALACVSVLVQFFVRMICSAIFKKLYEKYPQIILLVRLVPVVLYVLCVFLMDKNLWLGVVGVVVFYAISESFKTMPIEILYNYASSQEDGGNSLGISRLLEQAGVLVALVAGGIMLDVNRNLILLISIGLYLISVVPLVIYFVRSKNQTGFNADSVSNAAITFSKNSNYSKELEKIKKQILLGYGVTYFVYCFMDVIGNAFVIHLYLTFPSFGMAGYISALYNATFGVGCYLFGLVDSKKDSVPLVIASCLICMCGVVGMIFIKNVVLLFIITGVTGLFYGNICTFCLGRLLQKTRIMGISNEALFVREIVCSLSVCVPMALGAVGSMVPVLVLVAFAVGLSGYIIPTNEEKSRRLLIKFLQNHENAMSVVKNESSKHHSIKNIFKHKSNNI